MTEPMHDRAEEMSHATTAELPATNVIEALRRVIRDLPAIGKEGTGPSSQGGYKYRGIEQITRHAAPLFARHGLVMAPNTIIWRPTREITVSGKPNTDESLLVTYRVYGPGGVDDFIEVQAPGIGRDSSDKGSNKAMTAAYKYALTQMLAVADEKDDNDARHDDADPPHNPEDVAAPRPVMDKIRELARALRERGQEVTDTNDEGDVRVLDTKILTRNEAGQPWPAITEAEGLILISKLHGKLADILLESGDAGPPEPAATPPPGTAEEIPAVLPPEAPPDAYTGTERPGPTPEQAERARVAQEQLAAAASAQVPSSELRGQITKVPADDDVMAKTVEHVNGLRFSEVLAALEGEGLSVEGRPQQVRQRWADHLAAQVRARVAPGE